MSHGDDNCQQLDEFTLTKGISLFGFNCKNYDSIRVTCSVSSITLQTLQGSPIQTKYV